MLENSWKYTIPITSGAVESSKWCPATIVINGVGYNSDITYKYVVVFFDPSETHLFYLFSAIYRGHTVLGLVVVADFLGIVAWDSSPSWTTLWESIFGSFSFCIEKANLRATPLITIVS